ncbi:MAG: S8 family serine peptidase, partial [Candidatus Hodarchaeota archaeon]
PDILAPGRGVLSTHLIGSYEILSGTSMAAPAVAGVVALLLSAAPGANIDTVRCSILSTANQIGRHVFDQGVGLVNATAALERLQSPSVFAYPSFTDSSPLILSPGEVFEYQFDVFLNQSYNALAIAPSSELLPYVNVSMIDLEQQGWIRTRIRIIMPDNAINGTITIKNGTFPYFEANLALKPDINQNDAASGTDAGETWAGALPLTLGNLITAKAHKWDIDIYSFSVIKDLVYSIKMNNLTGNLDIQITDENGTIFTRGSSPGHLPEEIVFIAETSGTYFIRIEDQTPGSYTLLINEVSLEELSSSKPSYLTGRMESYTADDDSDGLFDKLNIYIEVDVSEAGDYDFLYSIAQKQPDYHYGLYVFMWEWCNLTLKEGIQNLTISVPGGLIESSGYNGSYIINDLVLGKSDFALLLNFTMEAFTTPVYDYVLFEPLDNRLDSYEIGELDIDKNGDPEKITVELGWEFATPGLYEVGVGATNKNQNDLIAFNTEIVAVYQPGLVYTTIEFAAQEFKNRKNIVLYGVASSWYRYLIPIFLDVRLNYPTFEPLVDYKIKEYLIDSDGNGKNESIRFTLSITSKIDTTADIFTGYPYCYPNETMILVESSKENISLSQGIQEISLDLDARMFNSKKLAGPFFFPNFGLTIELFPERENDEDFLMTQYSPYITKEYAPADFESPVAWLSEYLGGTKFNSSTNAGIEVIWEVTSTIQTTVVFALEVEKYDPVEGDFSKTINFTKNISPGVFNVTFQIEADDLFQTRYIGGLEVYYTAIYLSDSQDGLKHYFQRNNLSVIDFTFHAGVLGNVNFIDYASYVDAFVGSSPEIILQSSSIVVNTTIGVNKIGTYELETNLFSENDYTTQSIKNNTRFEANQTGNYTISVIFPAKTIVRNRLDKHIYGNITVRNLNTLNESNLNIPHFPINIHNFDYELPVNSISWISDRAVDDNKDGEFEFINLVLQVNVTKEAKYGFSVGIYAQLINYNDYYLGNVTISPNHLIQGLQNITFRIPYYYFLKIFEITEDLDIQPEIKLFVVPIYSLDDEGLLMISFLPLFLEQTYDLQNFVSIQPLAIGFVKTTQEDNDEDGNTDSVDVFVIIVVQDVLAYSLEVKMHVSWESSSNLLNKKTNYNPSTLGIIENTDSFEFSEIFTTITLPSRFSVNVSIDVISYDGILIDSYESPFNIIFEIKHVVSSSTTITSSNTDGKDDGQLIFFRVEFLLFAGLLVISSTSIFVVLIRRRYKRHTSIE